MPEFLFHPAFWMPLALGVLGVAVFVYGNARVQTPVRNAGLGIIAITFIWMTAAYFVDTFNEKCVGRTSAIIAAVETGNWDELKTLLDKNTRLLTLRGTEISDVAEQYAGMSQLKEIRIINTDVLPSPGRADVTIDTLIEAQQTTTSSWTFSYEQRSDGILLTEIRPIRVAGRSIDDVERVIGRISR